MYWVYSSETSIFYAPQIPGGKLLAFIRSLVSEQEQCVYCVGMNSGILLQYGVLPEMIAELNWILQRRPWTEKELAMLLFVLAVVKKLECHERAHVDKLRNMGWNDTEISKRPNHATNSVSVDKIFNAF